MKSRMYYLLLAAVTATFLTACDRTDNATEGDTSAPAAGSAGGVGTNDMGTGTGTGAEGTTSQDPATEIPNNTDPQSQDSGTTSNTDPNTTNTNP